MAKKKNIEEAVKTRFHMATISELIEYARECGEDVKWVDNSKESYEKLKSNLLAKFNVRDDDMPTSSDRRAAKLQNNNRGRIVPDYNLSMNGKFEGRHVRIKLKRPHGVQKEKARSVSVNGYHVDIVYDTPTLVPEFILFALRDAKRSVPKITEEYVGGVKERTHTSLEDEDENIIYGYEVDESTKHLCGSLIEWYQNKGPDFFNSLTESEMFIVARTLDLETTIKDGDRSRRATKQELLERLFLFVFGDIPFGNAA